jgi:hypothetical protein
MTGRRVATFRRRPSTASINSTDGWPRVAGETDAAWRAHYAHARLQIARMREDPSSFGQIVPVRPPPGSPIGATE